MHSKRVNSEKDQFIDKSLTQYLVKNVHIEYNLQVTKKKK